MHLIRNSRGFVDQDRFGGSDSPVGQRGNCMQVCLATVLGVAVDRVPHFYDTDEEHGVQYARLQQWLAERGWLCAWIPWNWTHSGWLRLHPAALVVVGGKSPRGESGHVVVGQITRSGWRMVHDPHPDKSGIEGAPNGFYLVAPTPLLLCEGSR